VETEWDYSGRMGTWEGMVKQENRQSKK